jgi:hypothetical protein
VAFEASRLDEVVEQVVRSLEFPRSPNTRSGWRSSSTLSIIATRSSNEEQADGSAGAPRASPTSGRSSTRALDLMGIEVPVRM